MHRLIDELSKWTRTMIDFIMDLQSVYLSITVRILRLLTCRENRGDILSCCCYVCWVIGCIDLHDVNGLSVGRLYSLFDTCVRSMT